MRKVDGLREVIANQFACEYKAYDLRRVCNEYGIEPDAGLEPMNGKRLYVSNDLNKMPDDDIWKLARRIANFFICDKKTNCRFFGFIKQYGRANEIRRFLIIYLEYDGNR